MVIMPLELTRARMVNVTPVLAFETVLVNSELPDDCTPCATASELKVGTDSPTFMVAGMLSVAISDGAAIVFVLPVVSSAFSAASSSRL